MARVVNTGLIGYGIGGQVFHAPFIDAVDGLCLRKIRVVKKEQADLAKSRYPSTELVADVADIINDPAIDLVVITTPNTVHHSLAKRALEADKHVVVDKPFTLTSADADDLIDLADKKQKCLSVFHSRRFDSDFRTVQKIIETGLLGPIAELESRYDRFRNYQKPNAWREENIPGSGLLYDLGSHLIDQALTLFGLPNSISADIRNQREGSKVDDNFELILDYGKIKVSLKAGMLVREPLQRFIVLGREGSYVKKGMDVQEEALKAGYTPLTKSGWGIEPEEIWGHINTSFQGIHLQGKIESEKGDYTDYYRNIYHAITQGSPLLVTGAQARAVIRVIELAMLSSQEKRTIPFTRE